jgi:hypothetical protein
MVAGAGSLIWISKGKVGHSLLNAVTVSTKELISQTHRTLKEPTAPERDVASIEA